MRFCRWSGVVFCTPQVIPTLEPAKSETATAQLYTRVKELQKLLEFLGIQVRERAVILVLVVERAFFVASAQENYVKEEQRNLKSEYLRAKEEVKRIQSVPVVIGQVGCLFFCFFVFWSSS